MVAIHNHKGLVLATDATIKGKLPITPISYSSPASPTAPFSFDMLRNSYSISARQPAFVESPPQRRARADFVAKKKPQVTSDQRIQHWVKSQRDENLPPMTTTATKSPIPTSKPKGHRRNRSSLSSTADLKSQLPESFSPRTSPTKHYFPAYNLTSIPEDEPYIFYSTSKSHTPLTIVAPKSVPAETTLAARPSSKRHQRHLSDLLAIPEE